MTRLLLFTATHEEIQNQGGKASFQRANAAESKDVQALVSKCVELYGRLDIFVANAGIFCGLNLIENETEESYDKTMAVNARGVFLANKYAISQMVKQDIGPNGTRGKIINIASIGGLVGLAQECMHVTLRSGKVPIGRILLNLFFFLRSLILHE
jgi:NAD(P)-dependent dehydrogenase (short-subunit alcohol dehydrogenase family)